MGRPDVSGRWLLMFAMSILRAAEAQAVGLAYKSSATFTYQYNVDLLLETLSSRAALPGSGFRIEAALELGVVWENSSNQHEQLIQLQIHEVKLLNVSERTDGQNIFKNVHVEALLGPSTMATLKKPVIFHWNSGKVEALYGSAGETGLILNLKRGLVSLFQLQMNSGTVTEVDVSGNCRVTYKTGNNQVTKIKDLHSCERPEFGSGASNQVLGVQWQPTCKGLYSVENGVIKTAVTEESHVVNLNLQSTIGAKISSRQQLHYLTSEQRPGEFYGNNLKEALHNLGTYIPLPLTGSLEKAPCKVCTPASDYLKSLNKNSDLQDLSEVSTTKAFLAFVQLLREAKKIDILNMLKKAAGKEISFLIDSATAAQTESSLSALSEYLDFAKEAQIPQLRTFLYATAFSSHPSKELLHILLAKLKGKIASREIQETITLVTGAVIGKMCQRNLCKLQEVEAAKKVILDGLSAATEEADVKMYLLALKNALLPETIPLLLKYTEWQASSVAAIAVTVLQRFPSVYISEEVKKQMNRIFHQSRKPYGVTVQLAALDVILNNHPTEMELKNILLSVGEIESEQSKYVAEKLQSILHSDYHPASKLIRKVLKDPRIYNYNRLSRAGSSSSSSGYLAVTTDTVSLYNLDLLFADNGILKQSYSDIFVSTRESKLHASQVTIEAQGLDSFFRESSKEAEGDDDEAMAGMSVILFDVQLPPVVFFQGYTDLMEKIWSITEEPISIIKGSILLIDHLQAILLQSGLQANTEFQGGLGIDISGSIELSLWSQRSKTNIRNRGMLVINSVIDVDTPFAHVGVNSSSEVASSLEFVSSVNFLDSPILTCLQLLKKLFPYRETVTIYESLEKGVQFTIGKKRTLRAQGTELPLHHANSEMCKKLLSERA
ncbi:microsomal triglyceride transfer protein large subunit-like isoform X1 [Carcharodon carcharias]|uniref:microsomal triglyceride transfer protein large subunit-like isoform X1 n=2 Tax=Carcharodon carcharias TaxID=13397 RepID=UPI001B7EB69F|nr:microsomal triglyceride transfer protein large subunit-like isoform X1 [Carcharodon carcharias]